MEVTAPRQRAIAPGVLLWKSRLGGPHQPVNSYLVYAPGGPVLIDPAGDLHPEEVPAEPVAILLTHVQVEHLDGAFNFPGVPVYVPSGDEYLCSGEEKCKELLKPWEEPWEWEERGNFPFHVAGARNERPALTPLPIAGTIQGGGEIFGLEVLSTPGHGKNAVSFLYRGEGCTFGICGDLVFGDGKLWNWFDAEWDYGLQGGQRALLESAARMEAAGCDFLLPAHGEVIVEPGPALKKLQLRLRDVLHQPEWSGEIINFEAPESTARGWRQLSEHLYQWHGELGNCAVLISEGGGALFVDHGLCFWRPLAEREAHRSEAVRELKRVLGISRVEICIPTHYHGDHIEGIPALVREEGTEVVCLDVVAAPILEPERFNLAAALWWYGTRERTVPIHRIVPSGTKLRWHEYELEIFHLGGQTYRHAGIDCRIDGRRVLFVGDAIFGMNPHPETIVCFNDGEPRRRGWLHALSRIRERQPDLLVCGHASAILHPAELLGEKIRRWHAHLETLDELDGRGNSRLFFDPFIDELAAGYPNGDGYSRTGAVDSPTRSSAGTTILSAGAERPSLSG